MRSPSLKIVVAIALVACCLAALLLRSRTAANGVRRSESAAQKSSVIERAGDRPALAPPPHGETAAGSPVPDVTFTKLEEFVAALMKAIESKSGAASISRLLNAGRQRLTPDEHSGFLSSAIQRMAEADPTGALAVLRQVSDLHDQQIIAAGIPAILVTKDPKAAAEWAASLAGHDMARNAHQTVAREWAKTDRAAVAEWLNQTSASVLKGAVAEGLAQTWAAEDLDGLTEWARGIADPYLQTSVLVKATKVLSVENPAEAADWAVQFPAGMARRQALTYAAGKWGAADPAAASQWAQQLADPAALEEAANGVMSGWMSIDKRAALAWANKLPDTVRAKVLETASAKQSP